MTRMEEKRRIDKLVSRHKKVKEETVRLNSLVDHYTLVWMGLIEKLDGTAPDSDHSVDISQYPSAEQVQSLHAALRFRKRQLKSVTAQLKKLDRDELD